MLIENTTPVETPRKPSSDPVRQQIRGSSLLLVGRLMALGINFVSQILIVHYLSTRDYGAWAYALSIVAFFQTFGALGLNRSIPRFIPIYQEREEYNLFFGTILLVVVTIIGVGMATVAGFHAFPHVFSHLLHGKEQSPLPLLFIMIFLVPVQALDNVLVALFACFSSPQAIFFRKYILGPGLQLIVVAFLIFSKSTTIFLAYGYLLAAVAGILIYGWVMVRDMQVQGLLQYFDLKKLALPFKEIFSYTIPLMTSDLVNALLQGTDALMLGYFCNLTQVAFFRVVVPLATLNRLAMTTFCILYTPIAARLFAKEDNEGIEALYWRTAIWMAAISFPVFAVTFALARPVTVLLYGARYAPSGIVLTILSVGSYFNVALGFNDLTVQIFGKMRYIVITNLAAAASNVAINLLLIPRYGALGAAIGTASTMVILNLFLQAGLKWVLGFSMFDRRYVVFYSVIAVGMVGLFCIRTLYSHNLLVALPLITILILGVFVFARRSLNVAETFPELVRYPLMRMLFT